MSKAQLRAQANSALATFLSTGNSVTRVPEAPRVTNEQLSRTRAEQFFRNVNSRPLSARERENYVGK